MKRIVAAGLWFYAFWYLGSAVAALLGVPDLLGPVLGLTAAAVVGLELRRVIWVRRTQTAPTSV